MTGTVILTVCLLNTHRIHIPPSLALQPNLDYSILYYKLFPLRPIWAEDQKIVTPIITG